MNKSFLCDYFKNNNKKCRGLPRKIGSVFLVETHLLVKEAVHNFLNSKNVLGYSR